MGIEINQGHDDYDEKLNTLTAAELAKLSEAIFTNRKKLPESDAKPNQDDVKNNIDINNLNSNIPPKLKALYKKLSDMKKKEDLGKMEFTQREMFFLNSGQFMNEKRITRGVGRDASKTLTQDIGGLTKEDVDNMYSDYKAKNPDTKISKKEFETLSQPIEGSSFFVKAAIDNREYSIGPVFDENWYLISSPGGSLFMCKPKGVKKGAMIYESWFIYNSTGKSKAKNTPIMIKMDSEYNYFVEDINGVRLTGQCAIGKNGDLYDIDRDGNIIGKDSKKYPVTYNSVTGAGTWDKDMFPFFWDFSIQGMKKDNTSGDPYLLLNIDASPEFMLASKYKNKKNGILISFQKSALYSEGYRLLSDDNSKSLILERNGTMSDISPEVLGLDLQGLDEWKLQAKEEVDNKLIQIEDYKIEHERKNKAFDSIIDDYCDRESAINLGNGLVYPFSGMNADFVELLKYNGKYAIKKWESIDDGQSAYIVIVDITNGVPLTDKNQVIFYITGAEGFDSNIDHLPNSIINLIKIYENKKSYRAFLAVATDDLEGKNLRSDYYMNNGLKYKGYYFKPAFGWENDWEYKIQMTATLSSNKILKNIAITTKMSGEDIKKAIDKVISEM